MPFVRDEAALQAMRERTHRLTYGPGGLPLRFHLPLDILLVIAGIAIYMHAAHVETAFFLIIGAKCVRRAVCEIVARTRFRSVLEPPPPLPTRAWSKY